MTETVEAVGWDISLGLADTGIGQLFIRATSWGESENWIPAHLDHVGIKVYGYVYEYGDCGILRTKAPKHLKLISRYPSCKLRAVENMGETTKTREEFEAWVREQNNGDFKGSLYCVVSHNCINWATEATKFLGVSYPENWDKIVKYAKNKLIATAVGQSVVTSRQLNFEPLGTFE